MNKKYFFYLLFLFLFLWLFLFLIEINKIFLSQKKQVNLSLIFKSTTTPTPTFFPISIINANNDKESIKVVRVIDGDTIVLENGKTVRYIGIDTPELNLKKGRPECYAYEAKKKNEELVLGKKVRLEKDVSETDKYGRLLRYVYVDDIFVNEVLLREGYATILTYPPDVKYINLFLKSQKVARENQKGLWDKERCKLD